MKVTSTGVETCSVEAGALCEVTEMFQDVPASDFRFGICEP